MVGSASHEHFFLPLPPQIGKHSPVMNGRARAYLSSTLGAAPIHLPDHRSCPGASLSWSRDFSTLPSERRSPSKYSNRPGIPTCTTLLREFPMYILPLQLLLFH